MPLWGRNGANTRNGGGGKNNNNTTVIRARAAKTLIQSRPIITPHHQRTTKSASRESSSMSLSAKVVILILTAMGLYVIGAGYSLYEINKQQQTNTKSTASTTQLNSASAGGIPKIIDSNKNPLRLASQRLDSIVDNELDDSDNEEESQELFEDESDETDSKLVSDTDNEEEEDDDDEEQQSGEAQSKEQSAPRTALFSAIFANSDQLERHRKATEAVLQTNPNGIRKSITAYIEPMMNDTIPGTGNRGDMKEEKDPGVPPDFIIPLPLRTNTPNDLKKYVYSNVQTCNDMPGKFPIDRGLEIDENGEVVVWNIGETPTTPDFPEKEAQYCPVELDPFLPWIHDVFPSQDGSRIEFIAQNKRRCRTGTKFTNDVNRLTPQVALMQSISVKRLSSEKEARELAPDLWYPDNDDSTDNNNMPRYRLSSHEDASSDGMHTRFICRFHATTVDESGTPVTVPLGETLSEYPFNYEMVSYRKQKPALLTPKGKDSTLFWASNIHFYCPVPDKEVLRESVATASTVLSDGTPTMFVDLIPIRTSVRYSEIHLTEDLIGPKSEWKLPAFDPDTRWGKNNVLPRVEASGRWTNIPICSPPDLVDEEKVSTMTDVDTFESSKEIRKLVPDVTSHTEKPHFLSACLWASAEFKTRGKKHGATTDTLDRLQEWIEFHLLVGFDHIYVYDNSGAQTNETSLQPVLQHYPGKVTRIDWPSIVCNNNIPAHDNPGERSSQYAAENSCRTRYGPFSEWMAAFDTDEYFVPMGDYTSLKDVLKDAAKGGTNILSLRSSRGRLRLDHSDLVDDGEATEKSSDKTFLEAYNCDSAGSPKPSWADRARKQIYRTDYVLYHYVHYSTVTRGLITTYKEAHDKKEPWKQRFGEQPPSERITDELTEAVMVHTKSLRSDMTRGFKNRCRFDYKKKWHGCWVAVPWPPGSDTKVKNAHDEDGMEYNCFINQKVDEYWVPKLRAALKKRKEMRG